MQGFVVDLLHLENDFILKQNASLKKRLVNKKNDWGGWKEFETKMNVQTGISLEWSYLMKKSNQEKII